MERKIGEIFEHNGEWYQCVRNINNVCSDCVFFNNTMNDNGKIVGAECDNVPVGSCGGYYRKDGISICFKKLEKVGEPFVKSKYSTAVYTAWRPYITVQRYRVSPPVIMPEEPYMYFSLIDNTVEIEIKKQENMEENKLNLKPFDLEAARSGKPVCTRDGRKARIICFDAKDKDNMQIIALVQSKSGETEAVNFYYKDGKQSKIGITGNDLMMLPEKKEGWVNIYNDGGTYYSKYIYKTEKEATGQADTISPNHVATVKIEWEE